MKTSLEKQSEIKQYIVNVRTELKQRLKIGRVLSQSLEIEEIDSSTTLKLKKDFDQKYILQDKLGEGAHAIVRRAVSIKDNKIYAVKIFRNGDPEITINIKKTYSNARLLKHDNIIKVYELYINEQTETSYLVMEYCDWPSLEQVMKESKQIPEFICQQIIHQLVQCLYYSHSQGICHRDIKPDNILVNIEDEQQTNEEDETQNGLKKINIKLIDFGVSKRFRVYTEKVKSKVKIDMWTVTGNLFYCAPEIFKKGVYDQKIDIWAVGVVLYQMLTNRLPFQAESICETQELIIKGLSHTWNQKFTKLNLSPDLIHFISKVMKGDPQKRLSAAEALEHKWLKSKNEYDQTSMSWYDYNSSQKLQRSEFKMFQSCVVELRSKKQQNLSQLGQKEMFNTQDFLQDPSNQTGDIHIQKKQGQMKIEFVCSGSQVLTQSDISSCEQNQSRGQDQFN